MDQYKDRCKRLAEEYDIGLNSQLSEEPLTILPVLVFPIYLRNAMKHTRLEQAIGKSCLAK